MLDSQDQFVASIASEAVEVLEDHLLFPGGYLLPLSARGSNVPGMADRPWSRLRYDVFYPNLPVIYSLVLRREPPDVLRGSLRARRTLFEGFMLALAEKTGRRPSMAERSTDHAMDAAESELAFGKPAFKIGILSALFIERNRFEEAETARRVIESNLRARGLNAQRLFYIAERALHHFQPGGKLFPGLDEPTLFLEETLPLLPLPSRQVLPVEDSVWIGTHARDGRDVHFSFTKGLDPAVPPPSHATTLILGEPGAGKTSLLRWIMLQRLLQGRTVISIDPEGENNKLCEAIGGKVVPAGIPEDKDTCLIHPLQGETPAEMLLAVRFLMAALAGESVLSPGVQAILHEAVKRRWERKAGMMTITEFVETLGTINSPDVAMPLALLRPFMRGGLFEGFFDRPKALLSPHFPAGQWWNFDLSSLREENRAIVHAVLAWFLYHAVTVGKQPMDIFIDEGWRLLRSGPFTDLLDELGRRARKRGVGVTLITHLPADLMKNPTSLSLASTAFIGRLGPDEAYAFYRSLGVPESEARKNAETTARLPPRVFLAAPSAGRGALFPVMVSIPPLWIQFWKLLGETGVST
ncbi:MAG: hypothetical protein KF758_16920 [Anaerolineales bacterium]|nr:hypothetical protein [Anaerolineales bacterium]